MLFEYKVRHIEHGDLEQVLDELGERGWELVTLVPSAFHLKLIFKRESPSTHPTNSIGIQFEGEAIMNKLTLVVGQKSTATIVPLEADGVTITPSASVSGQAFTLTDPSLTLVVNLDGTATITGVAASTGPVTGTASAAVVDSDGTHNTFTANFTVTVTAPPPPPGRTASIGVEFSTPA